MKPKTKKPSRLKAAVLGWLGVPVGLTDEAFWSQFGTNVAGQAVNECSVLKLSAVWACARLIAETISTLPLGLYEKTPKGRIALTDHPLYSVIHSRPNPDSTAVVFWEAMIVSMLLRGNGFPEPLQPCGTVKAMKRWFAADVKKWARQNSSKLPRGRGR